MRKLKMYLDSSIIIFSDAREATEYKDITQEFFEHYLDEYDVYISEILLLELNKMTHIKRKETLFNILSNYDLNVYAEFTDEIEDLANHYIMEGAILEKNLEDALHVAFATYYEFDILLSWDYKNIVNIRKQLQVNAINETQGYTKQIHLLNPMGVMYEK
jgi:predicted nucleic acid-binding protein